MNHFAAPWSTVVKVVSGLVTLVMVGVSWTVLRSVPVPDLVGALPILILVGAALFTVRGYDLADGELRVRRLLWSTRLDLSDLRAAWSGPEVLRRSLRVFGNGGLYSISGLFRSRELGYYRAFATSSSLAVVLEFPERKVVVTPDQPQNFLNELRRQFPHLEGRGVGEP